MITLYQWEVSPFCDKVRRVLHAKRQPYEVCELNVLSTVTGKLRKINPTGKLPAIEHEGRYLGDSTEIAHYLEEKFPDPPLLPKDPKERALVHVLEDWADESLYFYELLLRITLKHNALKWVPELTKRDSKVVRGALHVAIPRAVRARARSQGVGKKSPEAIHRDLERHVASVAALLGDGEWLVGDALSLADIAVFVQLFCIRSTVEGWPLVHAAPKVPAWMDRVDRATCPPPPTA